MFTETGGVKCSKYVDISSMINFFHMICYMMLHMMHCY